jgi:hypothetical protein
LKKSLKLKFLNNVEPICVLAESLRIKCSHFVGFEVLIFWDVITLYCNSVGEFISKFPLKLGGMCRRMNNKVS